MKILFNTYSSLQVGEKKSCNCGGPINFTKIFLGQFFDKKHQLVGLCLVSERKKDQFVSVERKKNRDGEFVKIATYLRIKKIIETKQRSLPSEVFSTIKILSQELAKEKSDLLFLNGFSIGNWYLLRAAALAKIPVVAVHHGLWFKEADNVAKKVSPSAIYLMRQMEKEISRYATKEVFLNEFSLDEYQRGLKLRVDRKKTVVVPLPYDPFFEKRPIRFFFRKNKVLKIGMVGRWDPIKNPQILVALAKMAAAQGKNWEFNFVAKITEVASLTRSQREIHKWVKVWPPMKSKKLRAFYDKMDLMILPSRFDVSPGVVIEALLQNKMTLISPNVGWVSLYKKMSLDDWIIDFKNLKKVVERIEKIALQPVSKKIVSHIRRQHRAKFVFDRYEKIFKAVIKKV